ncbi:unnamed protein product (macronuclear) [Paramecium tetraurelia]|uniref:Uncharacterized protein n=1 Tax=Paramecium tetraurelia TaxID=5888 RepID=A0CCM0_PARTE|nr:uncharacterized protein GSPATT00037322001 [Paramecium tetraurelia]CAK68537.1 unnamed protein product [Paramecium tetraurelia]|eukprot:XP_001435934.1 hypothetical protein (macronuclear) [Paramecium tetraurelia strain d4-2]
MLKSSRSLSSRKIEKLTKKRNNSVSESGSYGKFLEFLQSHAGQPYSQFLYMQEFFNTNLAQFPTDDEISQIQHNLHVSSGLLSHKKKNWTIEEKKVLIWIVGKLSQAQDLDIRDLPDEFWEDVSEMVYRRDAVQCKQKWSQLQKTDLQSKPFTQEEDQALLNIINKYQECEQGQKWSLIANELNLHSRNYRSSKQCRERWLNHLNPRIRKDPWKDDEDFQLLNYVQEQGRRWADISKLFNGTRSENNVKNRFNSLVKREKDLILKLQNGQNATIETMLGNLTGQNLNEEQIQAIEVLKNKIIWRQRQLKDNENIQTEFLRSSIVEDPEKNERIQMKRSTIVKYAVGHLQDDQITTEELTPCLVNIEKNMIYFCSKEQILQIINRQLNQIQDNLEYFQKEVRIFDSGLINQKTQLSIISEINDSKFSSFICGVEENQSLYNKPNVSNQHSNLDNYLNLQSSQILQDQPEGSKILYLNPIEIIHYKAFQNIQKAYKSENLLNKTAQEFKNIPKSLPNVISNYTS